MSVHELEAAIIRLTPQQLLDLLAWLQEYHDRAEKQRPENETEVEPFDATHGHTTVYAAAD